MNELDIEKEIPTKPREVLGILGGSEYECTWCGESDGIRPPMNNCPWCGQLFKWD